MECENAASGAFLHLRVGAQGELGFVQKDGGRVNIGLYDISGLGVVMLSP